MTSISQPDGLKTAPQAGAAEAVITPAEEPPEPRSEEPVAAVSARPEATMDEPDPQVVARRVVRLRRMVLARCLAELGFDGRDAAAPQLPLELVFDGQRVTLEGWEREVLLGRGPGSDPVLSEHLRQGLALRLKCAGQLQRMMTAPPPPDQLDRFLAELILDAAVGLALQQEIQGDIDDLVAGGRMDEAKKLTGFRRKLDRSVATIKEVVSPEAYAQAEAKAVDFVVPTRAAVPKKGPGFKPLRFERKPRPPGERRTPHARAQTLRVAKHGHLRSLLIVFGLSLLFYTIFFFPTTEDAVPPRLGDEHFSQVDGILEITARPPSLFVRFDAKTWGALSQEKRVTLVEEIGRIAGAEGYSGLLVRTNDGAAVGQWLKKTGASLLESQPGS